ncbi:hypothetical protein PVL29_026478 [Vitis rotundifolia]|uniref:Uncharacterized protein n=1 Tax=Vitis rotundifolia TaxID=103349 RepID=A0AA39D5F2_VITRO|nr:hypothetical protein PVL29_026478 [Vitis rotundifolia]
MDYRITKAPPSSSHAQKVNHHSPGEDGAETTSSVTSHLYLRSSETLDKDVVLRRIRHHKVRTMVRALLSTSPSSVTVDKDKWVDLQDDAFSNP